MRALLAIVSKAGRRRRIEFLSTSQRSISSQTVWYSLSDKGARESFGTSGFATAVKLASGLAFVTSVGALAYSVYPEGLGKGKEEGGGSGDGRRANLFQDATLVNRKGEKVSGNSLNQKILALYFSAHWCPPCRGFTPTLKNFYSQLGEEGKRELEIVFVSSDHNETAAQSYFEQMHGDWLMIPFDSELHRDVQKKYGVWAGKENETIGTYGKVNGIPTLLVTDPSGRPLSYEGRDEVNSFGLRALPLWLAHESLSSDLAKK